MRAGPHFFPARFIGALAVGTAGFSIIAACAFSWTTPQPGTVLAGEYPAKATGSIYADAEDRSAFLLFATLTHATSDKADTPTPDWDAWSTKADVGLPDDGAGIKSSDSQHAGLIAMEFPTQIVSSFVQKSSAEFSEKGREHGLIENYAQAPQLASVLFNPQAAKSVVNNMLYSAPTFQNLIVALNHQMLFGADRHLPGGSFAEGSIAIKLIWEIVPKQHKRLLRFYDPAHPYYFDSTQQQLQYPLGWKTKYVLDVDHPTEPCPLQLQSDDPDKPAQLIPIKCLYAIPIAKGDTQALKELSGDSLELLGGAEEVNYGDVYAVLVGVHIMRLTRERPQWEWMTFYWTNTDNGQGWKSPWRFFNMMSTDALRDEAYKGHQYCYSPYLEGYKDGVNANCLNCHRLAAYGQENLLAKALDLAKGDPTPDQRRALEEDYFTNAVQTGFIWSLSTSQPGPETEAHKRFARELMQVLETELTIR
jgi:hypothetical protein